MLPLPLRCLTWMVLLISLARAAAERPPVLHWKPYPLAQQHFHFTELANNVGYGFGNEKPMTGSGNALAAEIVLEQVDAASATASPLTQQTAEAFPPGERRPRAVQQLIDWLLWQEQRQTRNPKQAQQQEQQSLRLANVALPVFGTQQPAFELRPGQSQDDAAGWATMPEIVDSAYHSEMPVDGLLAENVNADGWPAERNSDFSSPATRRKRLGYPFMPYAAIEKQPKGGVPRPAAKGEYKRAKEGIEHNPFLPSISAGAMTHLGNFFHDLSKNIHFTEKSELGNAQSKLLEGDHPLRMLHEKIAGEHEANAELLHAIRTYRPSQKIRSLVAMNPRGYHGSQFIDPNYMWVGLGK